MARFPTLKGSWPWPWIGSYCIPWCITHRPLPTCQDLWKSKKLFVDVQTDGRTLETGFIRVDLKRFKIFLKSSSAATVQMSAVPPPVLLGLKIMQIPLWTIILHQLLRWQTTRVTVLILHDIHVMILILHKSVSNILQCFNTTHKLIGA